MRTHPFMLKPLRCMRSPALYLAMLPLLCVLGCASPKKEQPQDPLRGWHFFSETKVAKDITDDYQAYIQELPAKEKYYVPGGSIFFFEDDTGRHAVRIEIPLNGIWIDHVIIYNRDNKRESVITFENGRYAS